ncbi:zinc transporter ZupT [Thiohalomonas denitrificans]|uniref:Zinc transporter ZupT n=1 Tax=Thiohalomonas denitrificans TaxID=415747 RepID=A0A1G5PQF8_9GAMM|nr:zinc transporter ZupT [Thiohalomonas denitrificans]SCZ51566.1 zinc transporter, ZIP family [Thiohalomonas denitrificans]
MEHDILFALGLTALAGLSTGIGSAIAVFTRRSNKRFLAASLGFSAGVMIYVAFLELLPAGIELAASATGAQQADWIITGAFFAGILLTSIIDFFVPSIENPHTAMLVEEMERAEARHLKRVGVLTALAIGIHNFPEGIATFMAALSDPTIGVAIAVAIALHNIPEGISVAVPIYYATGSRRTAFWFSLLSGLAEPVGAIVAFLLLMPFLSDVVMGAVLAAVAGIMVFIALDTLIPNAKKYGQGHDAVYGLISGMALMAASLLLLDLA